ncbi:MAG: tetratricopeptide repeat protein, partial [Bacteroidales bacterium]|nr:tetratricopeptide repeat protein [Bacteroidales bacterium]
MKRIHLFLFFLLIAFGAQAQHNQKELWMKANNNFLQAQYQQALEEYLEIESMGYVSAELYYNIGNTYFKLNNIPRSILWYERALKLEPSDPDIKNNLSLAREYTLDRIEEVPDFIVKTWFRDLNYTISSDGWSYIALFMAALTALLLLNFKFNPNSRVRKLSFFASMVALLLALSAFSFAWTQRLNFVRENSALIMKPVSTVKSSPDNSGNT